nr:uncharacterized protein LOC129448564 [Misgurnus anguillicaudatus]
MARRLQSEVVQPEQNLRTVYTIPTLNYAEVIGAFDLSVSSVARYNSFRLLIINAVNATNTVSIKRVVTGGQNQVPLNPYFLYQLESNGEVTEVSGTDKIAVILTHPCFDSNCSCNMMMSQLRPVMLNGAFDRFPITVGFPYINQLFLTTNQSVQVAVGDPPAGTGIQVSSSTNILPLLNGVNYGHQLITTSMPVSLRLIIPGIILDIIPVSMFSGCFLVHFYSSKTRAVIVAETSSTALVQMNDAPLSAATWDVISGTQYSITTIGTGNTQPTSATIWHPNSKIAVYMTEMWNSGKYTSPAIIINDEPDPNGCMVLTPGKFVVGNEDLNWTMSREYCNSNSSNFFKILLKQNQDMMATNIIVPEPTEGWISLRRSLFNTEWYWSNSDNTTTPLNFTYWADKQPGIPVRGLCAAVSMDPGKTFMWKSARCCSLKKPICYKTPTYLILNQTPVY